MECIGKRVQYGGDIGTVISSDIDGDVYLLIEFDSPVFGGHNGNGLGDIRGRDGHCWWVLSREVEFIINKKLRIS